jgi:hypothetical protein
VSILACGNDRLNKTVLRLRRNADMVGAEVMSTVSEFHTDVRATSKVRPPTVAGRKSGKQRRSEQEAADVERRGRRPQNVFN